MTHPRKAIRHAIRDRLSTAVDGVFPTVAEGNVFASRIAPITDEDYPAILIYSRDEKEYSEPVDGQVTWRKSTATFVVEGLLRAGETVDDKLDDLAEQIEAAFDGWRIPGFEAANLILHETDIDVVTENVRRPIGAIGMTYAVTYRAPKVAEPVERIPDEVDSILWGGKPVAVVRPGRVLPIGGKP